MGSFYKGLFQWKRLPQMSFIRNKHKHNISKPRLPHFERHVVEHVCVPYFAQKKTPQYLPDLESCNRKVEVRENFLEPYFDLLAKEALEKINSSKLVGFFHVNTFNDDDVFESQILLKKNGMRFLYCKKQIITRALTGTIYEPVLQLFKSYTLMATSEQLDLPNLLKVSKKMRKYTLMAAMIEGRLLSLSELKYYAEFESLDNIRIKLLQVLNSGSQNLVQQLNQNSNIVVQCLNQRAESLKNSNSKS